MFCPSCGSEERQASQYCRACGTDLRSVRVSLERPDSVTASAVSARADIGRAVADRIREVEDAHELKKVASRMKKSACGECARVWSYLPLGSDSPCSCS